jgi:hypothetical protein
MSLLSRLDVDEVLTVRTYKVLPGAPLAWANTYELIVDNGSVDVNEVAARLNDLKNAFVNLERNLLNVAYVLDRIIISTYVPDGTPYNPYTFASYAVNQSGTYTSGTNPLLPLQLCTVVKRIVNFGRQGTLLYRGIVTRNDAEITPGGTIISVNRANAISSLLNTWIAAVRQAGFDLVMARGSQSVEIGTLRRVTGLSVRREMTFKKLNNRYFDRVRN